MTFLLPIALCLVLLFLCLQYLLSARVLARLLTRRFGERFAISMRGPGFILPILGFSARRFRLMVHGSPQIDRVFFQADRISFLIDPLLLLFGRLRLVRLRIDNPYLEYVNRIDSFRKNRYLPRRHRVEIKSGRIRNGFVTVRDETRTPVYRMELREIELDGMDVDVGTPVDLLFRTRRGSARIGSEGLIEIGETRGGGFIRLRGVTWGEISSLPNLPFAGGRLALAAYHTGGSSGRKVQGQVGPGDSTAGELASDQEGQAAVFEFDIDWNDYAISIDLGFQKLIGEILTHGRTGWLSSGFLIGGRSVFQMLKKPER